MTRRLLFRGHYVNAVIAGRGSAGEPVVVVAGQHSRGYPYAETAAWDHLLVLIGERAFTGRGRTLALHIDATPPALRLGFAGPVRDAAGATVDLALDLVLDVDERPRDTARLGPRALWGRLPGMTWRPAFVGADVAGHVDVGGARSLVGAAAGELEHGALTGIRGRRFAIAYDYLALAAFEGAAGRVDAAGSGAPAAPFAHVHFETRLLHPGWLTRALLGQVIERHGASEITLHPNHTERGPVSIGVPLRVHIADTIDLGLARLERRLVQGVADGHRAWGLAESFEPA